MNAIKSILGPALFVCMLVNLYLIFMFAPSDTHWVPEFNEFRGMGGQVQRIFYFHVPTAWASGLSLSVLFIFSILYLWKKQRKYDLIAHSAGEIAMLFITLFLITGPIWARPVWNVWWKWDARLTLSLVLWFIFVAYLMLRNFVESEEKGARLAAVFAIVGFVDVPFVYMAIRWWPGQHPSPVIGGDKDSGLDPDMQIAFYFSVFTFTLLFLYLLIQRVRLQKTTVAIAEMKKQLAFH